MILWGVSMVRNEADIVEAFVRHNLSIFFDGLLVIDHGSADTTLDVLNALCRERVPLVVMKNEAVGYMQQAVMTQAVRHVFANTRADFVFPLDADEFRKVMSRAELERALSRHSPLTPMASCPGPPMFQTCADPRATSFPRCTAPVAPPAGPRVS